MREHPYYFYTQGALVGGPDAEDNFEDNRNNYKQSEVALDYNSCFQGTLRIVSDSRIQ